MTSSLPDPELSRAVLIGLPEYDHLPALPAVANNIAALREFFTSAEGWRLPTDHCVVVTKPRTPSDVVDPLRRASTEARDTLFVYYAGHGVLDEHLQFYLSLLGSHEDEPWTCVDYRWIRALLAQSTAQRRIAVLDSCFSGKVHGAMSAATDAVRAQTATKGTVVVTSARDDRVALAPPGETYTAFTGELLAVLQTGIPGGPANITVDHAYAWVRAELARKGRPRPDRTGSDTAGAVVLAQNHAFDSRAAQTSSALSPEFVLQLMARRLNVLDGSAVGSADPEDPIEFGGRYRVAGLLGNGDNCRVYLASDKLLERWVAVKAMHGEMKRLADISRRIAREFRAVAQLSHPMIATVHDVGDTDGVPYFVTEYVRGASLLKLLDTAGRFEVAESAAVILGVLEALRCAHERQVLHCDVKLSNVMVTADGMVKVLDFGLAAYVRTTAGTPIGTLGYMAPEAARGAMQRVESDLYAVGATFYQLLTGRQPLSEPGMSPVDVMIAQLMKDVPPPSRFNPALPPECDRILLRALAKDPEDRYPSAAVMAGEISELLRASK
jgi:hypothetical protein